MNQRFHSEQWCVVGPWRKALTVALLVCSFADAAFADGTGSLDSFIGPLKNGLNLIMIFGFIAGFSFDQVFKKLESAEAIQTKALKKFGQEGDS